MFTSIDIYADVRLFVGLTRFLIWGRIQSEPTGSK